MNTRGGVLSIAILRCHSFRSFIVPFVLICKVGSRSNSSALFLFSSVLVVFGLQMRVWMNTKLSVFDWKQKKMTTAMKSSAGQILRGKTTENKRQMPKRGHLFILHFLKCLNSHTNPTNFTFKTMQWRWILKILISEFVEVTKHNLASELKSLKLDEMWFWLDF